MSLGDAPPPDGGHDPFDQLRHDLKTPLTTIYAHAQLVARSVQRSSTLSEEERVKILAGLTGITGAVREMVSRIDGMGQAGGAGDGDATRG